MAILGSQNNGGGFTRAFNSTAPRRMNTSATLVYTAGHVVQEVGVWLQATPGATETVRVGIYDISAGADGAPLIYTKDVTATTGSTAESYITVTGLEDALTGLSGGETLALALAWSGGTLEWPGRRVPVSASMGNTGINLVDPWVQASTSGTESPDAYMVLDTPEPSGPTVTAPESVSPGETISFTATGFTPNAATVSDGTSTLTLTSITNTSGDNYTAVVPALPAVGASLQYTTFGAVTLEATDGTDTAEDTTSLVTDAFPITILGATFSTGELSWLYNFTPDPEPIEQGDQGTPRTAGIALGEDGSYVADSDGTYNITVIDKTDGVAQTYPLLVGPGETPSVVGRLTRRNLTSRNLTRRSLTSRP